MSKKSRKKVEYPSKREIQSEIHTIIEQSNMFTVNNSNSNYVECRRVKSNYSLRNMVSVVMVVAVIIIALAVIVPVITEGYKKSSAKGPGNEKEQETNNYQQINVEDVTRPSSTVELEEINVSTSKQSSKVMLGKYYSISLIYSHYMFSLDSKYNNSVSEVYENKFNKVLEHINEDYLNPQESMVECNLKNISIKNRHDKVKAYKQGDFFKVYDHFLIQETYNDYSKKYWEYVSIDTYYGDNYDVLTYEKILKDYETGINVIAQYIYDSVQVSIQNGNNNINKEYHTLDGVKNMIKTQSSWELGSNGITIYANKFTDGNKANAEYAGLVDYSYINFDTYQIFFISYDKYDIVKDEYK